MGQNQSGGSSSQSGSNSCSQNNSQQQQQQPNQLTPQQQQQQPMLSPQTCLAWQMANWELRGVSLYAAAIPVTAEVGVPLLILNLVSTVVQNAMCSNGGASHF
jgi:hypothetical protein